MNRSLELSPRRNGFAALLATSLVLASTLVALPAPAYAQFTGNNANDLTSQQSTDLSQINNTPLDSASGDGNNNADANGSTRLRSRTNGARSSQPEPQLSIPREPYKPGEFESYVQKQPDAENVRRFGANLVTDDAIASATQDPLPSIPADYIIRPGDEVSLAIWGTVDADLLLTVDRAGRITVPRVGAINVAGLRNADLADAISHRVAQTFKNFQLTATLGQVRAIRVFVSGYVQRPGTVTVSGLSSVLHALMRAGGPSAAGSFRDIHLRRAGKEVALFDLYDLLLKGSRDTDRLVQPDDVIFVGPVGTQVAVLGSVNVQAIYELRAGETLNDALRMAGGFTAVADRSRVSIERLADRATGRVVQLDLPAQGRDALGTGDVVRAFSVVAAALPLDKQNEHVRVEGEVARPGDYILPPGSRMADAIRAAGGMTAAAYPFGTEFTRESVRKTQQVNYERALRDLETDISRNQANQRVTSTEELSTQAATAQTSARLLERLRQVKPTGRVVLQLPPDAASLPNLALEDGDSISIPARGTSVGIFGSVFNTGSFVYQPEHTADQYLALAGGPTRGADRGSIFMLRANGSVISAQQGASFWHASNTLSQAIVQPGDTIFVPEELGKASFIQGAKDWTQILYQFGLGWPASSRWDSDMTNMSPELVPEEFDHEPGLDLAVLLAPIVARWKTIALSAILCGGVAYACSYLVANRYTASSVFMPPQSQSSAAGALASLGALSSLAGGPGLKNTPDQYIALMQSATVSDRIITKFGLKKLYESKYDIDARTTLAANIKITAGKKDSLITVDATDKDPTRAAAIANQYVEELRRLTNDLAVTEAQQRRVFFEQLLQKTRDRLAAAQIALEASGYSAGALNVEPKSAADSYARLRAELTAAQVKLEVMRGSLADMAPEFQRQRDMVNALSSQVAKLEAQDDGHAKSGDYINRYREFKYQETLFDLYARQYESARVDESREGALIQVLDPATPPERKSGPRRLFFGLGAPLQGSRLPAFWLACAGIVAARPSSPERATATSRQSAVFRRKSTSSI